MLHQGDVQLRGNTGHQSDDDVDSPWQNPMSGYWSKILESSKENRQRTIRRSVSENSNVMILVNRGRKAGKQSRLWYRAMLTSKQSCRVKVRVVYKTCCYNKAFGGNWYNIVVCVIASIRPGVIDVWGCDKIHGIAYVTKGRFGSGYPPTESLGSVYSPYLFQPAPGNF